MLSSDYPITPDLAVRQAAYAAAHRWGRTWVEIDPLALRRNWLRVVERLPARGFAIACVKKDGYGHGLFNVARALAGAPALWGLGVATLEEALVLRQAVADPDVGPAAGLTPELPVLILVPLAGEALTEAVRLGATLTVTDLVEAAAADRAADRLGVHAAAHLKLDTGMGRLGRLGAEVAGHLDAIRRLPNLRLGAIYTHLADGWHDLAGRDAQRAALERFREAAGPAAAGLPVHWGGSDAMAFAADLAPGDGLRVGIALYGDHPAADFEPAMTFKTRVVYRRAVPAGTPISYGSIYVAERESELAVIGAGYGNGLMRALGNRADVLIGGRRCPIRGRVCMDQAVVDVTDLVAGGASVREGDEVVIFGRSSASGGPSGHAGDIAHGAEGSVAPVAVLPASEQAAHAGTISYELFCLAGQLNPRVSLPASP